MKKLSVSFLLFLFLSAGILLAEESLKLKNMASFMGLKWGISKVTYGNQFKATFKEKNKEFRKLLKLKSIEAFRNPIQLEFTNPDGQEGTNKSKENLVLTSINIRILPQQFEDMLDVFKVKYGDPTNYNEIEFQNNYGAKMIQKIATWDNEKLGRSIIMTKFGLNNGMIELVPFKSEEEKQQEQEKLMKEREERLKKAAALM